VKRIPIRQQLEKWQKEQGNPLSELLGLDLSNDEIDAAAEEYDTADELTGDIPNSGSFQDGDELLSTRGIYYNSGDLVELS
jgi:hypothetical protein